jgi:hypothetical protein
MSINYSFDKSRHSGESRNPGLSKPSGCRIKSGMTEKNMDKHYPVLGA